MEYRNHVQGDCAFGLAGRRPRPVPAIARQPRENWSRLELAAALVESGRIDEAKAAVAEATALSPKLSLDGVIGRMVPATRHRVMEVLKRAGLE
jgi:hypothetical protein